MKTVQRKLAIVVAVVVALSVPVAAAEGEAGNQDPFDALMGLVGGFMRRVLNRAQADVQAIVHAACVAGRANGLEFTSVSIEVANVTATFTLNADLCDQVIERGEDWAEEQ